MAKNVKRGWFTQIKSGGTELALVEKTSKTVNGVTDEWQALTESGLKIMVELVGLGTNLSSLSEAYPVTTFSNVAERYHKTIVSKVISMGYMDPRNKDLQSAEYFDAQYLKGEKRAKKMARSHYFEGSGNIIPQDF